MQRNAGFSGEGEREGEWDEEDEEKEKGMLYVAAPRPALICARVQCSGDNQVLFKLSSP